MKLFHTTKDGVTEVTPRLDDAGVRFLASEYVIDCVDGGRIDSLGIDENGAPVIVEYKRGTDAGVINQGLYYLSWLARRRSAFDNLVRDRLGVSTAAQVLWSSPA